MRYITLHIAPSRVVLTRISLSIGYSAVLKLLSPSRLFLAFSLSSTLFSYYLPSVSLLTPKNLCYSMLSG
jgi:hypothetical protein